MPSIVIDSRMINHSGIGVYLQNLIPFLSREFNLKLLGDEKDLLQFSNLPNIDVITARAPIYSIKEQLALRLKVPQCDLFWSPHYNIPLLPIAARKRVVTIHDVYHLAYQHTLTLPQKLYAKLFLNAAVKFSDTVITVSDFSKKEILKYTSAQERTVVTIHNGVDTEKFYTIPEQAFFQENYNNKAVSDKPYILFVGNVKPHKNLVTLLQAFTELLKDDANYNLVIVGKKEGFVTGDSQVASMMDKHARLRETVIFTGYIKDDYLTQLYQNASVLVFPSVYEGFGLPPLEAMASGCAVITSTAASIPEICGQAVEYFDAHDHLSLVDKLKKVLYSEAKRAELVTKGLNKVKEYTWEKAAKKHVQVFSQLINERA